MVRTQTRRAHKEEGDVALMPPEASDILEHKPGSWNMTVLQPQTKEQHKPV